MYGNVVFVVIRSVLVGGIGRARTCVRIHAWLWRDATLSWLQKYKEKLE